jgi:hypothetical protein
MLWQTPSGFLRSSAQQRRRPQSSRDVQGGSVRSHRRSQTRPAPRFGAFRSQAPAPARGELGRHSLGFQPAVTARAATTAGNALNSGLSPWFARDGLLRQIRVPRRASCKIGWA